MLLRDKSLLLAGGTGACCLFLLFTSCSSWRTFAANSSLFDFSLLANSLRRASKRLHYTEMRSRILSTQQERERKREKKQHPHSAAWSGSRGHVCERGEE